MRVDGNHCGAMEARGVAYELGMLHLGSGLEMAPAGAAADHIGAPRAWDVRTTGKVWWTDLEPPDRGPVPSTTGGLVFAGGTDGSQGRALDAEAGGILWSRGLDGGVVSPPTSFEIDGERHVAFVPGRGVDAERFRGFVDAAMGTDPAIARGGSIWVFALP